MNGAAGGGILGGVLQEFEDYVGNAGRVHVQQGQLVLNGDLDGVALLTIKEQPFSSGNEVNLVSRMRLLRVVADW